MQKITRFIKEVIAEFKNITWPKRETLIQLTVVVISISIIISLILGGFDYLFTNSISLLGQINKPKISPKTQVEATPSVTATSSAQNTTIPLSNPPIKK